MNLAKLFGSFHDENTTEHVRVTAKVFSPTVHDDVRSPFEGILERRWPECSVDGQFSSYRVYLQVINKIKSSATVGERGSLAYLIGIILDISRTKRGMMGLACL